MSSDMVEISMEFDDGKKEETEKNEKETEVEDADEYVFHSINLSSLKELRNYLNIPFNFTGLSVFREVDSPPPIS